MPTKDMTHSTCCDSEPRVRKKMPVIGGTTISANVISSYGRGYGTRKSSNDNLNIDLRDLPLSIEVLNKAGKDAVIIAETIEKHPETVVRALRAFQSGRLDLAIEIFSSVGLSESELKKNGGGFWGLVVIVAVALVVLFPSEIAEDPPPSGPVETTTEVKEELQNLGILKTTGG